MNERIKQLRKALKLTQAEFAARLGMKQNSISNIESGTNVPTNATIVAICRTFGCGEEWLRTGEGEMFPPANADEELAAFLGDIQAGNVSANTRTLVDAIRRTPPAARDAFVDALAEAIEAAKKNNPAE